MNSEKYELELALGGNQNMANFDYAVKRQDSVQEENDPTKNFDPEMASLLYISLLQDFCVKSYREHYDRIGWLWTEERASHELEVKWHKMLPLASALVYIAILMTKEEKI